MRFDRRIELFTIEDVADGLGGHTEVEKAMATMYANVEELSLERYPMLGYAIEAINKGSVYPTILNAANEVAVGLFLEEKISFLDIEKIVKEALNNPIFDKFALGDLTIPKIMSVDELVRIQILTKYR